MPPAVIRTLTSNARRSIRTDTAWNGLMPHIVISNFIIKFINSYSGIIDISTVSHHQQNANVMQAYLW